MILLGDARVLTELMHMARIAHRTTSGPPQPTFKAVIVGRDSLTSVLLADSLVLHLKCNAVAARHSDLLRVLRTNKVDLVIISVDLNSIAGAGFDLASAVSTAHPDIRMILLTDEPGNDSVIRTFRSGVRGVFSPHDSMTEFID